MTPRLRKFALSAHIASSVGWLGAIAGFLALAIAGLTSQDAQMVRAAYLAMEWTAWFVIVPLAFAALLSGIVQSLSTSWGLLQHYWVLTKLVLTVLCTVVLLVKMKLIGYAAAVAAVTTVPGADLRQPGIELVVHAGGGILVLLVILALSVYKPWGMTRYGRRKLNETRNRIPARPAPGSTTGTPRWAIVSGIVLIVLVLLSVIVHIIGGGLRGHGP